MEIKINGISDKGNLKSERIGFQVIKGCELKFYLLFRTNFTDTGNFYNKSESTFWFPPTKLNTGDKIVVYTKSGQSNSKMNEDGTTTYFFYWGLNKAIFNNDKEGVVLAEVSSWITTKNA